VLGTRRDDLRAVAGCDDALRRAEQQSQLTLQHLPTLLLTGVQMRRQHATGLEPRLDPEVLAVGLECVAHMVNRITGCHADHRTS
jgi:hypothetical protein